MYCARFSFCRRYLARNVSSYHRKERREEVISRWRDVFAQKEPFCTKKFSQLNPARYFAVHTTEYRHSTCDLITNPQDFSIYVSRGGDRQTPRLISRSVRISSQTICSLADTEGFGEGNQRFENKKYSNVRKRTSLTPIVF